MGDRVMKQRWDHPLLLVGCYLNLWFRELEFIRDEHLRPEYRSKAEEFARKLVRQQKERIRVRDQEGVSIDVDEMVPCEQSPTSRGTDSIVCGISSSENARTVGGRKERLTKLTQLIQF